MRTSPTSVEEREAIPKEVTEPATRPGKRLKNQALNTAKPTQPRNSCNQMKSTCPTAQVMSMTRERLELDFNLACQRGNTEKVTAMLEQGASPDARFGKPLRNACEYGHLEIVKLLLKAKANPAIYNNNPILLAVKGGHTSIVEVLLQTGANIKGDGHWALISTIEKEPCPNDLVQLLLKQYNEKELEELAQETKKQKLRNLIQERRSIRKAQAIKDKQPKINI